MVYKCLATLLILVMAIFACVEALVDDDDVGMAINDAVLYVLLLYLLYAGGFYG